MASTSTKGGSFSRQRIKSTSKTDPGELAGSFRWIDSARIDQAQVGFRATQALKRKKCQVRSVCYLIIRLDAGRWLVKV